MNECASGNGGCFQICTNTVGTYNCSCRVGYSLGLNNHTCEGKLFSKVVVEIVSFLPVIKYMLLRNINLLLQIRRVLFCKCIS